MNRIIKFRAWDGLRMTTSGIMFNTSTGCVVVPTEQSINNKPISNAWVLMQFTGLLDSKGKEIYEGDIVKRTRFNWHCIGHEEHLTDLTELHEVYFDEKTHCMSVRGRFPSGGGWQGVINFEDDRAYKVEIEVVGNVYENIELLEK